MRRSYHATVHNDHLVWNEPDHPDTSQRAIEVEVKVIEPEPPAEELRQRYIEAAEILRKIAARGEVMKLIPDPVAWQREMREDVKLHGRP